MAIPSVATSIAAFVGLAPQGPEDEPVLIQSAGQFAGVFGATQTDHGLASAVQQFFANGGTEAYVTRTRADLPGSRSNRTGIYALDRVERFNLLCLLPPQGGCGINCVTWRDAAAYCLERRAMLLIDPPSSWTSAGAALVGVESLPRSPNAAVFFPSGSLCGAIAGLVARTDANQGVWKPAAGIDATLVGIGELGTALSIAEVEELNASGVNCLRSFPQHPVVVWGARTLARPDSAEYQYIPVRRLALFLEASVFEGLQWVVFEPNAEPLWAQIRVAVRDFLGELFRKGAFQGATPNQAYFVRCDEQTTTQADIENGRLNIVVGFAPLRPAEFVIVTITQLMCLKQQCV